MSHFYFMSPKDFVIKWVPAEQCWFLTWKTVLLAKIYQDAFVTQIQKVIDASRRLYDAKNPPKENVLPFPGRKPRDSDPFPPGA